MKLVLTRNREVSRPEGDDFLKASSIRPLYAMFPHLLESGTAWIRRCGSPEYLVVYLI